MTEMTMAPWEQGSRRLLMFACAGCDEEAVGALLGVLEAESQPSNTIEKMWLRDIALLTIRAEHLRLVQVAVHRFLLHVRARQPRGNGEGAPEAAGTEQWATDANEAATVRDVLGGSVPGDNATAAISEIAVERLLGMTYAEWTCNGFAPVT